MSKEERIKALKELLEKPLKINLSQAYKRIEKIMGRPVMEHELAFPEFLYEEIRSGKKGSALRKSIVEAIKLTKTKKGFVIIPEKVTIERKTVPIGLE